METPENRDTEYLEQLAHQLKIDRTPVSPGYQQDSCRNENTLRKQGIFDAYGSRISTQEIH